MIRKIIFTIIFVLFSSQTRNFAVEIPNNGTQNIVIKTFNDKDIALQQYLDQNKKFLSADKSFKNLSAFKDYDTYEKYKQYEAKYGKGIKIMLEDGDFAIINSSLLHSHYYYKDIDNKAKYYNYYALEYHSDGTLMGIIKIKPLKISKKNIQFAFYEYRLNDSKDYMNNTLKHIQIYNIKKQKEKIEISQFIYRNDRFSDKSSENQFNIVCYRVNDSIYVKNDEKNLIKDLENYNLNLGLLNHIRSNYITDGIGIIVGTTEGLMLGPLFITTLPLALIGTTLQVSGINNNLAIPFIAIFTKMVNGF